MRTLENSSSNTASYLYRYALHFYSVPGEENAIEYGEKRSVYRVADSSRRTRRLCWPGGEVKGWEIFVYVLQTFPLRSAALDRCPSHFLSDGDSRLKSIRPLLDYRTFSFLAPTVVHRILDRGRIGGDYARYHIERKVTIPL